MSWAQACPCGSGTTYDGCCGRLHRGAAQAETPEELMRSRYAAYAVGGEIGEAHLFRTWHPRTRPADLSVDPAVHWRGLQVLGSGDDTDGTDGGWVEFAADYELHGATYQLHEHSLFERRGGRWVYLSAAPDR